MDAPSPTQMIKQGLLTLLVALALWAICGYESHVLRPPLGASPQLSQDPLQTPTTTKPFVARRGGERYYIEPVYNYEISGLLVELHDSDSWNDMTHTEGKDFINTRDLCVVWGENLKNDLYRRVKFSHGDWTCYFQAFDGETFRLFRQNQISNNHVLPADDAIARAMKSVEIGDQIYAKGMLVNYERSGHPPSRNTSITRDDTGNGACEIIWVSEFKVLKRAQVKWRHARDAARVVAALALLYVLAGFALGMRPSSDRDEGSAR